MIPFQLFLACDLRCDFCHLFFECYALYNLISIETQIDAYVDLEK
jgi:hypothetical protein